MEFTVGWNIVLPFHVLVNNMVTCTLDPIKLPLLCVGERCKRFHAKTWGRAGVRNFRPNDDKYFLCCEGVAVVQDNVSGVRDYSRQSFFPFWGWSLLDRGRKKNLQEPTMITSYVLHSVSGQPVAYLDLFKPRKRRPRRKRWQKWSEGCRGLFPCSVISTNLYKLDLPMTHLANLTQCFHSETTNI